MICPNAACHWESHFGKRVIYKGVPVGYVDCPNDHGEAGEIETLLHKTVYNPFMGPVAGIEKAAEAIAARYQEMSTRVNEQRRRDSVGLW